MTKSRPHTYVYGTADLPGTRTLIVRFPATSRIMKGETLHVTAAPSDVHVFDSVTGARI
jgi:hypothetical protein